MTAGSLVSIIVPVYNGERFLDTALNSVLAQTYRPIEIIVIDDGSTDHTAKVAQSHEQVRYAYQTNGGIGEALNHGITLATGDYFSFLDADDLWTENKLTRQLQCFASDISLEAVFGHLQQFYGDPDSPGPNVSTPLEGYFKGTMLISRAAFFRVGLFDPQWRTGDFIDWFLRAREKNLKCIMLDDVFLKRRIHEDNLGRRERDQRITYVHILKQALDRRQQHKP